MRLHRRTIQTVNFGSSTLPFLRRRVVKILTPGPHSDLNEAPSYVLGTYVQCCGKSNVASAASEVEETRKGVRVPKGERKSMVESYVKRFRAMNDGKFPSVSDVQREVGGSFYILRDIILELKYNLNAPLKVPTSAEKVNSKKDALLTDTEKTSRAKEEIEYAQMSKVDSTVFIPESFDSEERAESPSPVRDIRIDDDQHSSSVPKDSELHSHHSVKGLESSLNSDRESKVHCDSLADESERELKVPNEDNEPQGNTSMWQNLKSFAKGILGIWRGS